MKMKQMGCIIVVVRPQGRSSQTSYMTRAIHRGDVSSLLYTTPPPQYKWAKGPPGGGGGSWGGKLAAEEGFSRGLASCY